MKYIAKQYHLFTIKHLINNTYAGAFLDMGLGKTGITLTVVKALIRDYLAASKVLVIAPKRVTENVWIAERDKWDHLKDVSISLAVGNPRQRIKALNKPAEIYCISRDNFAWLVSMYQHRWPFDMVIVDESSSFKNHASVRFKSFQKIRDYVTRAVILTGTPASNGLIDLWAQLWILDKGERLGKNITAYRDSLFYPAKSMGHHVYSYEPQKGAKKKIFDRISDICISMKSEDYLKLPKFIENVNYIDMPPKLMQAYEAFEREKIMEIASKEITAINAAALTIKLRQFANGFLYDENKVAHDIHKIKLEALDEIIEGVNGKPMLLFYYFQHDLKQILKRYKHLEPNQLRKSSDIDAWNHGLVNLAVLHPQSAAHGLNLQQGGNHIAWYAPIWSAEQKSQASKRLHRPGQKYTVFSHMLATRGTIEPDMIEAVQGKISLERALIEAVKARVKKYTGKKFLVN